MLIDNKKNGKVGDVLKQNIKTNSKLSIISAYFTIYAFAELKKELMNLKELRLLFTAPIYQNNYINNPIFGVDEEITFKNSMQQVSIAKECANWVKQKVQIKEVKTKFDEIWNNKGMVHDIKEKILNTLEELYTDKSPQFLYFLTLYNFFSLTLIKLIDTNQNIIDLINNHSNSSYEEASIIDVDIDSDAYASQLIGNKVKVLISDVDKIRWRQDLEGDLEKLETLLAESLEVDSKRDNKLKVLKENITHKINNHFNANNKKVIIFTAFADTAQYLYQHINRWAKDEFGVESCVITGGGTNKTTLNTKNKDLNSLLTHFSPISKINIGKYEDEQRIYVEVYFMVIEVTSKDKIKQISNIIQTIFAKPIILIFQYENEITLNITPKRVSKVDSSKLVAENLHFTSWIDLQNPTQLESGFKIKKEDNIRAKVNLNIEFKRSQSRLEELKGQL